MISNNHRTVSRKMQNPAARFRPPAAMTPFNRCAAYMLWLALRDIWYGNDAERASALFWQKFGEGASLAELLNIETDISAALPEDVPGPDELLRQAEPLIRELYPCAVQLTIRR